MLSTTTVISVLSIGSLGAAAIVRSSYKNRIKRNELISPKDYHEKQKEEIKNILSSVDKLNNTPLLLYKFTSCPYCSKLQVYLDYNKIKYKEIEVNPINKKELLKSDYKKVPQLQLGKNGPYIVDSNEIIQLLKPLLDPSNPKINKNEQKWIDHSKYLTGLLVLNTNRNLKEAKDNFSYADKTNFSSMDKFKLKHLFPVIMFIVNKYLIKPRLIKQGIYNKDIEERTALYNVINEWISKGIEDNKSVFNGGNSPNLADLCYYGILKSQSQYNVFNDIKNNVNQPQFNKWYDNMKNIIEKE